MTKINDLTGKKFGKLKVISFKEIKNHRTMWKCVCNCSKEVIVSSNSLMCNRTKSCGCIHKEQLIERNKKHNLSKTKLYKVWQGMKTRCYNKNFMYYHNYGGRGIIICDKWKNDFSIFYDWAIKNGYREGLTIDRIDNDGNYEPNNCRWVTRAEQNRNKRYTKRKK